MKKLLFIFLVTASVFSVYAGGSSELDKIVNPESFAYFEITNPDKGIEAVDAVLKDFGLMQILGIQSIKQELTKKSKKMDFQYVDFNKPFGFSLVYAPDAAEKIGIIAYIPLKNKKDFDKLLQSFPADGNEVLVNDGSYAVMASDKILVKDFPYKKNFDMTPLKDKNKHLVAGYLSVDSLFEITNEDGRTFRELFEQELAQTPEMDLNIGKIFNAYFGLLDQIKEAVFYADMDGTIVSADAKLAFRDKTKADEFIRKIPAGNNIKAMLEYLPEGYMMNFAADTDSATTYALSEMILDLIYEDDMSNAHKAQIEGLMKAVSDLSGPMAAACNMDYSKLMTMSMMAGTTGQAPNMDRMDLMDLTGIKLFEVIESSNPKAFIEANRKIMESDAYINFIKDLGGETMKIDLSINSGIKYRGISFDEFTVDARTRRAKPDEGGYQIPSISMNFKIYTAENGKMVFMGIGEGIQDTIAEIITSGGKPKVSVLSNKAVLNELKEVPDDAVAVGTFSMMTMLNSMMSALTGGMDFGQLLGGGGNSAGGFTYMTIDKSDLLMKSKYDLSELQGFVSFLSMMMQMSNMGTFGE